MPSSSSNQHNRCFTYPDGDVSIVPQILSLMAAVSTILAFDIIKLGDSGTRNFMCKGIEIGDSDPQYECAPLRLNSLDYYADKDTQGWATALQVGAVFGVIAATTGVFAFCLLITSTCFSLKPRRLLSIVILQAIAGFFSVFSLIAGAVDGCKAVDVSDNCENVRGRLAEGGLFMLAAFFLYIAALIMNVLYLKQVRQEAPPPKYEESQSLTAAAAANSPPPQQEEAVEVLVAAPPAGGYIQPDNELDV